MPLKFDYQQQMKDALLTNHDDAALMDEICADGLNAAQRMGIYRHNVVGGLVEVLLARYPTLVPLAGDDFARGMAQRYILAHPPQSGNLNDYAADYAAFLAAQDEAAEFPFLSAMAALENLEHLAYYAAFLPCLTLENADGFLPRVEAQDLTLRLNPAVGLLQSAYPLRDLRAYAEDNNCPAPDMSGSTPHYFMVSRRDFMVESHEISAAEFAFLNAVAEGADIHRALEQTLQNAPDFDFTASWQKWVERHVFAV